MRQPFGDRYWLGDRLGPGLTGPVHTAGRLDGGDGDARVVMKVVRDDLVTSPGAAGQIREAVRRLAVLLAPNLVPVHDVVEADNRIGIVVERVHGDSLRQQLDVTGPLLPSLVAGVGAELASGLAELHANGFLHLDVKPSNILMDGQTARLTDYCLAPVVLSAPRLGRDELTFGMPQYVAPEIPGGGPVGPGADMYALGIVLYELSCGVTPFAAESRADVLRRHAEFMPGRPDGVPDELWLVLSELLAKDPQARPTAARTAAVLGELAWQLGQYPVAPRRSTPPPPPGTGPAGPVGATAAATLPSSAALPPLGLTGFDFPLPSTGAPVKQRRARRRVLAVTAMLLAAVATIWLVARPDASAPQTPGPGADDGPTVAAGPSPTVSRPRSLTTTTEAAPTAMPNLVGKSLGEARELLPSSTDIEVVPAADSDKTPDTIVDQEPAAGKPFDGTVRLMVVRQVVPVYLADLEPASGQWSSSTVPNGVVELDGEQYLHSLASDVSECGRDGVVDYNLSKGYRRLVATAGQGDDAKTTDLEIQLEIFADGRPVLDTPVEFGKVVPIDVDLAEVLRLRIRWTLTSEYDSCYTGVAFALGTPKLYGFPEQIPTAMSTTTR